MMNTLHLEILSPERAVYIGDCISMVFPTNRGMMGVMANHSPLSAAIPDGVITFTKPDGEKIVCAVTRGMVDVGENRVILLCESALAPDEIDEEAERREIELSKMEMKKTQSKKDYKLWKLSFDQSVNRLKVKKKQNDINI
ncbi:MAG: ATP synthase F1 subunit epsilon [Oscillospiraceae bacterium]|nr:ATP synthase F1 subunit epsilon [Oscillospiraceae bacterium]